ncbi:FecR family protein [Mucilaginibacter gynuensis]|uniref:FecR family protein n=1 Tax=Mucilaginibacter gynuensis TaxID=1302236 RepID=UPI0031ED6305
MYQRFLNNDCTDEELSLLFHLFETADEDILKRLIEDELSTIEAELPANAQETERLNAVRLRVKTQIGRGRISSRTLIYSLSAAAAIIVALTFTFLFWQRPGKEQAVQKEQVAAVIKPGGFQATLTLANGKKIVLNRSVKGFIASLGHTTVSVSPSNGVSYTSVGKSIANSSNTLATGRGEQSPYPLILADGSKVWLNAASSITFPSQFTGNDRVVTVKGEVYFEVAHNVSRPFKILSGKQEITVLGTHFNVKAYDDENCINTTLLQGSVKVKDLSSGASNLLVPGQQSRFNKTNGELAVAKANLEEVIAWKNGFFMFNDQKITSVMKSMSRWYDVDIEYQNFSDGNEKFGGTFSRSSNLGDILSSLQSLGNARFKIINRKIIVCN